MGKNVRILAESAGSRPRASLGGGRPLPAPAVPRNVQRGSRDEATPDRDDRFLKPEGGEYAGSVETVGEGDCRTLEFGRKVTRVHRIDRDAAVCVGEGSGFAPAHLIGERQHISPPDANRPVDRLVSDLLCCRSRSVSGIDIDGDDATASLRKRPRDRQTVSDADFHEAVVFREFVDQRAT